MTSKQLKCLSTFTIVINLFYTRNMSMACMLRIKILTRFINHFVRIKLTHLIVSTCIETRISTLEINHMVFKF